MCQKFLVLIFFASLFMVLPAMGQTSGDIDSLLKAAAGQQDSVKYATMRKVANMYNRKGMVDSAFYYDSVVLKYAKEKGSPKQLCAALLSVAGRYIRKSNFDAAMENLFAGLKIAEREKFNKYTGQAKRDIGYVYQAQNRLDESLRYLKEAEKFLLLENDSMELFSLYCQLGDTEGMKGDTAKSLGYLYQAATMGEQFRQSSTLPPGKKEFLTNLRLGNFYSLVNIEPDTSRIRGILGKILVLLNNVDSGVNLYQKFATRVVLANIQFKLKSYRESLNTGETAISIYKQMGKAEYNQLRDLHWVIGNAAANLEDYKKAFENLELYRQYNDTLFNTSKLEAINSVEAKYQTEKKEQVIAGLKKEKKMQRMIMIVALSGILALGGLLFVVVRSKKLQQKLFEKEKLTQRLELEQRMTELEQTALRAQMNPHFIFNCLNSVQRYVIRNDVNGANLYLTTFASLIRQTLENSGKAHISLKDELTYLDTYIRMEQIRGEDSFEYDIKVDNSIDTEDIYIPNMLIQPFVENSIHHGLKQEGREKSKIRLAVSRDNKLVFIIEDNGPGLKKATGNPPRQTGHHSMGSGITEKRIELYNNMHAEKISISITDKSDVNTSDPGTLVRLEFPVEN